MSELSDGVRDTLRLCVLHALNTQEAGFGHFTSGEVRDIESALGWLDEDAKGDEQMMGEQIDEWFTFRAFTEGQRTRHKHILDGARDFAHLIDERVMDGADKTAALRKLRECVATTTLAIVGEKGDVL